MRTKSSRLLLAAIAAGFGTAALAAGMSDEELIQNAVSAAPEAVGKDATVVNWDMKELRKGTNGFTCCRTIPPLPATTRCAPMRTGWSGCTPS